MSWHIFLPHQLHILNREKVLGILSRWKSRTKVHLRRRRRPFSLSALTPAPPGLHKTLWPISSSLNSQQAPHSHGTAPAIPRNSQDAEELSGGPGLVCCVCLQEFYDCFKENNDQNAFHCQMSWAAAPGTKTVLFLFLKGGVKL